MLVRNYRVLAASDNVDSRRIFSCVEIGASHHFGPLGGFLVRKDGRWSVLSGSSFRVQGSRTKQHNIGRIRHDSRSLALNVVSLDDTATKLRLDLDVASLPSRALLRERLIFGRCQSRLAVDLFNGHNFEALPFLDLTSQGLIKSFSRGMMIVVQLGLNKFLKRAVLF